MSISIINLPLINNNYQSKKVNFKAKPQENSVKQNHFMPAIANNYMAKINFKGGFDWNAIDDYTNDLKKRIYSKRHMEEFAIEHKDASGITKGRGLPEVWTSRIKDKENFDKDSFIQGYGEIFKKERKHADVDRVQEELTNLFQKHKIIDEKTPLSVKYIGHGFQAWAYKVSIDNDDQNAVVTKLFKKENNFLQNHGNHTEQNLAEYVKEFAGDNTEFVKYHYGDTKNGIMLVDYLPSNIEPPTEKLDLSDIGIGYGDDFPKNRINGHICDFGGIETVNNLIGNKTAQEVHSAIKYAESDDEKIKIFNNIFSEKAETDEFKNKAIGLVYGIKYMPEDMQPELYKKCHDINSHRVNIALIYSIKDMTKLPQDMKPLIEELITNSSSDQKEQETIAKEIKYIPDKPRHRFFEEQTNTKISAVIKYLARNINQYYKDLPNRRNIYETFVDNSDRYSGMALINSMHYMSPSRYDGYFEKFHAKNDPAIDMTLARNLELLKDDSKTQEKWINKLSESKDENVTAGLAESIPFVNEELRAPLLEKLLPNQDKVTKEFIAQNITSVPGHTQHPEWIKQLLDGADNMVRGSLANTVNLMKDGQIKEQWKDFVCNGGDDFIKNMVGRN